MLRNLWLRDVRHSRKEDLILSSNIMALHLGGDVGDGERKWVVERKASHKTGKEAKGHTSLKGFG